jgi:crotonobetainyl-CoA:carnitine CoA-transferase CaiB-like acyl-CoA transferase
VGSLRLEGAKRSVTVDLKSPRGLQLVKDMAKRSRTGSG